MASVRGGLHGTYATHGTYQLKSGRWESIAVQLTQARRKAEQPLHALEFVQPILRDLGQKCVARRDEARRTARGGWVAHHLAIFVQRAFAVARHFVAVLAEKDDNRHAVAGVNLQRLLNVAVLVAVEVAHLDDRSGGREVLEDRTLVDAVAAPGAGQTHNRHRTPKGPEQLALGGRQLDLLVDRPPTLFLRVVGVAGDELGVRQTLSILVEKRHHFFSMRSVNAGELFCRFAAAVAVPSTSTPGVSPGAALAAAVISSSTLVWPMAMAVFAAVTFAGSLRISTAIGPM